MRPTRSDGSGGARSRAAAHRAAGEAGVGRRRGPAGAHAG